MLKPFRGTYDHLPDVANRHDYITDQMKATAGLYGFGKIDTPLFEYLNVFTHSLGDTSDIVTKEMFVFEDRHNDKLALRPEGTAGVMRALITNKLTQDLPQKFFYYGPMFRYERPQKGRNRQFHQLGVELIGDPSPQADIEVITMGWDLLCQLGLKEKIVLEINTLGDTASRENYRKALIEHFENHAPALSEDSQTRLKKNPMRILDSKSEQDQSFIQTAPKINEFMTAPSKTFFEDVLKGLEAVGIPYTINPRLVRGLDYYCHTAFEFTSSHLGSQSAVLAGGRYDNLSEIMGGPSIPGVGWAAGIERLDLLLDHLPEPVRPVSIIPIGSEAEILAIQLSHTLRSNGIRIDNKNHGNLKSRMKYANKIQAKIAILIGEDELKNQSAVVKDLDAGTQETLPLKDLVTYLKK
jgi:histidyl-tRNA synthetase